MSGDGATREVTSATSEVWNDHVPVPGTPADHGSHHLSDQPKRGRSDARALGAGH